jgi:hypothetical protein
VATCRSRIARLHVHVLASMLGRGVGACVLFPANMLARRVCAYVGWQLCHGGGGSHVDGLQIKINCRSHEK